MSEPARNASHRGAPPQEVGPEPGAAPPADPGAAAPVPIGFRRAMELARDTAALFTELKVDAIVSCERTAEGWRAVVDVVEAPARLGDNDLLASYEVILEPGGECERFARIDRYHRSDAAR